MPRYKLTIEYNGNGTAGWQKQINAPSIQQYIEEAIEKFTQQKVLVYGAGRTDAGVHATAQVAHVDIDKYFDPYVITRATNHFLKPTNIVIINCELVDDTFHARFDAVNREYCYKIINRKAPLAIYKNLAWHISAELNIELMQKAAEFLLGRHNFTSFRATECQAKNPVITLDKIDIIKNGEFIEIYVAARSFLHHMVRNIVGTLKLVGEEKLDPEIISAILKAEDRSKAGPTAPPDGLYLIRVDY